MSDHEQVHEARKEEAEGLESSNASLEENIEAAKDARDRAASDSFVASPTNEQSDAEGDEPVGELTDTGGQGDGPPPEAGYTSKE